MREVGQTTIRRSVAIALSLVFLLTLLWTPTFDRLNRSSSGDGPLSGFLSTVAEGLGSVGERGFLDTNRRVKEAMDRFESSLEETSWWRRRFVPSVQWRLATTLGLGNEQVFVGRDGWLFYRADVDHVIGRGFLEPTVLRGRARAGDLWSAPPQPDPLVVIERFVAEMESRGIRTIVMPTPVKPSVDPEPLIRNPPARVVPIQNASYAEFLVRLETAGVTVFDPAPLLVQAKIETGSPQYLRTDTHWGPAALIRVSEELARVVEGTVELSSTRARHRRQKAVVEGLGDVATMLDLPENQDRIPAERVEIEMVLSPEGTTWRPDRSAEVLLLGDSFSNVYSDGTLGWGSSAGLAEQLSFELGRPIDRIAVNAGGPRAAREALDRAVAEDPSRLAGVLVVVYQFATRELSQGDWQLEEAFP